MQFSTMAALMLSLTIVTGTLDAALIELGVGRTAAMIAVIAFAAFRPAVLVFSPEFELCPACVSLPILLAVLAARRNGRRAFYAVPAAFLLAIPALFLAGPLSGDALILASALLPLLAAPFLPALSARLLAAALVPLFLALFGFAAGLLTGGYAVFEASGAVLDMQLTGLMFSAFLFALRVPRRKPSAA